MRVAETDPKGEPTPKGSIVGNHNMFKKEVVVMLPAQQPKDSVFGTSCLPQYSNRSIWTEGSSLIYGDLRISHR